ncbi:uncharacterized protein LOC120138362 [Hibiscus syriacus]|uniref:uncharacterized protein LOC120138362 n=1 Tax=Hibiscus syriacus TaxID=106335 RepID=UPI0019227692|nr:uncharacterized protein LOC120138362 [Hibiscus syriacus]
MVSFAFGYGLLAAMVLFGDSSSSQARMFTNKRVNVVLDEMNFFFYESNKFYLQFAVTVLNGSLPAPPETVVDEHGETIANESYEDFVAQDSALAPDISFSVNKVAQYMHAPREQHLLAAKRILRYLAGKLNYGLGFMPGKLHLSAFSDADWGGCADYR